MTFSVWICMDVVPLVTSVSGAVWLILSAWWRRQCTPMDLLLNISYYLVLLLIILLITRNQPPLSWLCQSKWLWIPSSCMYRYYHPRNAVYVGTSASVCLRTPMIIIAYCIKFQCINLRQPRPASVTNSWSPIVEIGGAVLGLEDVDFQALERGSLPGLCREWEKEMRI